MTRGGVFWLPPLALLILGIAFTVTRTEFHYDNWDIARNALTLHHFGPDPYGYAPWRPPLPTLIGGALGFLHGPGAESLPFMRALQLCSVLCVPLYLLSINWVLKLMGLPGEGRAWVTATLGSSVLVWASAVDSLIDLPAGLFGALAVGSWLQWRDSDPRLARLLTGGAWLLAAMTRQEYLVLGSIFILDDICRSLEGRNGCGFRPLFHVGVPVTAFLALSVPLALFSGNPNPLTAFTDHLIETRRTFAGLDRGFQYHRVFLFALPWPVLAVAMAGLARWLAAWRHNQKARLLFFYCALFMVTHVILIPQQYVRFLIPFVLPLSVGFGLALSRLSGRLRAPAGLLLMLMVLVSTGGLVRYFQQEEFRSGFQVSTATEVSAGKKPWFVGKSFPRPVGRTAFGPGPEFSTYHFGSNALRVVAGRRSGWMSSRVEGNLPVELIAALGDGDRVFHNRNTVMYYHSRGEDAEPAEILQVRTQLGEPGVQASLVYERKIGLRTVHVRRRGESDWKKCAGTGPEGPPRTEWVVLNRVTSVYPVKRP